MVVEAIVENWFIIIPVWLACLAGSYIVLRMSHEASKNRRQP